MTGQRYAVTITRPEMPAIFEARGQVAGLEGAIRAADLPWPAMFNQRAADARGREVLRIGPKRVIILAPMAEEAALDRTLSAAFAAVIDADMALVSDMFAAFHVAGVDAEAVLRQGAPLDLSAEAFPINAAAGTEIWGITALILRRAGEPPEFLLLVDASHAGYLADWLAIAAGLSPVARPGVMRRPPATIRP